MSFLSFMKNYPAACKKFQRSRLGYGFWKNLTWLQKYIILDPVLETISWKWNCKKVPKLWWVREETKFWLSKYTPDHHDTTRRIMSCFDFHDFFYRLIKQFWDQSGYLWVPTQCEISWNSCQESCKFLKLLVRILPRFLPRAPRICTILQDLGKNFKKNAYFFRLKKRTKMVLVQKIFQEKPRILSKNPRILPRNPRNAKNLAKKFGKTQELAGKSKNYWMIMNEHAWKSLNFFL